MTKVTEVRISGIKFRMHYKMRKGNVVPVKMMHKGEDVIRAVDHYQLYVLTEVMKKRLSAN